MAREINQHFDDVVHNVGTNGRARLRAAWIIERWRKQGFDRVAQAPSGYCSPVNSRIMHMRLPDGYKFFDIDEESAKAAIEESIEGGMNYRF